MLSLSPNKRVSMGFPHVTARCIISMSKMIRVLLIFMDEQLLLTFTTRLPRPSEDRSKIKQRERRPL